MFFHHKGHEGTQREFLPRKTQRSTKFLPQRDVFSPQRTRRNTKGVLTTKDSKKHKVFTTKGCFFTTKDTKEHKGSAVLSQIFRFLRLVLSAGLHYMERVERPLIWCKKLPNKAGVLTTKDSKKHKVFTTKGCFFTNKGHEGTQREFVPRRTQRNTKAFAK
jgi:hypothetical protein